MLIPEHRSSAVIVEIEKRPGHDVVQGQRFINLWGATLRRDLFSLFAPGSTEARNPDTLAQLAHAWHKGALSRGLGAEYGNFTIRSLHLQLYPQSDCRGPLLVDIDVTDGTYELSF